MLELPGSVHASITATCMAVAVKSVGVSGLGCVGVTSEDSTDSSPLPVALTARILKV